MESCPLAAVGAEVPFPRMPPSDVPVAWIERVFESGKPCAVGGDVALGLVPGHIVIVAMVERPQVFRRIRFAGRDVDDLPAEVGIGLAVIRAADPGAAFVLAPQIAIDVAAGPAFFPHLLNQLFAVFHGALLFDAATLA